MRGEVTGNILGVQRLDTAKFSFRVKNDKRIVLIKFVVL